MHRERAELAENGLELDHPNAGSAGISRLAFGVIKDRDLRAGGAVLGGLPYGTHKQQLRPPMDQSGSASNTRVPVLKFFFFFFFFYPRQE